MSTSAGFYPDITRATLRTSPRTSPGRRLSVGSQVARRGGIDQASTPSRGPPRTAVPEASAQRAIGPGAVVPMRLPSVTAAALPYPLPDALVTRHVAHSPLAYRPNLHYRSRPALRPTRRSGAEAIVKARLWLIPGWWSSGGAESADELPERRGDSVGVAGHPREPRVPEPLRSGPPPPDATEPR